MHYLLTGEIFSQVETFIHRLAWERFRKKLCNQPFP